jgi:hypothetical protein
MSLNEIRAFHPCASGWNTLLKAQGKTLADDVQIPLLDILKSNGIKDAIWCMKINWFQHKELYMKFINKCAERAKVYAAAYTAAADAVAAYAADAAAYADADAAAAAYAADAYAAAAAAADAAAYAADAAAAAAYADAYADAERKKQYKSLELLLKQYQYK